MVTSLEYLNKCDVPKQYMRMENNIYNVGDLIKIILFYLFYSVLQLIPNLGRSNPWKKSVGLLEIGKSN